MKNKISILGSNSFIGRAIKKEIKSKYKINFYNRNNLGDLKLEDNFQYIDKNTSQIILLASQKKKNLKKTYYENIQITQNSINHCLKRNIKLIFFSTYIPNKKKNFNKLNYYQKSKLHSEKLIQKYKKLNYLILRLPNIFGELNYNKYPNNFVDGLIKSIKYDQEIFIFKPFLYRSYLHVNEIVKFLSFLLRREYKLKKTVNLNVFKPLSTHQILSLKLLRTNKDINFKFKNIHNKNLINYYHKNDNKFIDYKFNDRLTTYLNSSY